MTEKDMMKEALEWQEHIRKLITATDDELYHKRSKVFEWLIQQAERVEELEKKLSINTNKIKQLQNQKQYYKQALEEIRGLYPLVIKCLKLGKLSLKHSKELDAERELDKVTDVARQALEEEKYE